MGKKVTPEEIKKMNELYLIYNTYAGVAKEVGRAPTTVKRYIDPDYLKKKEKATKPLKKINWKRFIEENPKGKIEKIFWLIERPGMEGYLILQNKLSGMGIKTDKSYNLFPSKILGISFKEFLEICEEGLGAEINFGKNKLYPSIYFKDNAPTRKLIEILNYLIKKNGVENLKNS